MPLVPLLIALVLSGVLLPSMAAAQGSCGSPSECPEGEIRDPRTGRCGPLLSA